MKGSLLQGWDGNKKLDPAPSEPRQIDSIPVQFDQKMLALCRMATSLQLVKKFALESGLSSHDDKPIRLVASDKIIAKLRSEGVRSPSDVLNRLLTEFPHELRRDHGTLLQVVFGTQEAGHQTEKTRGVLS